MPVYSNAAVLCTRFAAQDPSPPPHLQEQLLCCDLLLLTLPPAAISVPGPTSGYWGSSSSLASN
jgi:hypothetical protein